MMTKTKTLLAAGLMSVASLPLQAQSLAHLSGYFQQSIRSGWPQLNLRADQERWLADKAAGAYQDCLIAGVEPSYCLQIVQDSLVEMIGDEPAASLAETRQQMRPAN